MRYIKIIMRDEKNSISLPFEKADALLSSQSQLVKITDENGKWTGITVNKADIAKTERDFERERQEEREKINELEQQPMTDEEKERYGEAWKKLREEVETIGIIKKI